MREIEFRAWLKQEKEMYKVVDMDFELNWVQVLDEINAPFRKQNGFQNRATIGIENVEFMQYTGIDDEDGTKIFEGDIVEVYAMRFVDYSPKSKYDVPTKIRGVVKFKTSWNCIGYSIDYDNSYNEKLREPKGKEQCKRYFEQRPLCYFDFNVHKKQDHPNWVWKNHIKVIGNVFENPELLGEKDDIKE